jgi:hypothetical protein
LQESSFWDSKQQQQQQFTESNEWPSQNRFFYDTASLTIWIGRDWLDKRYGPYYSDVDCCCCCGTHYLQASTADVQWCR